jgi:hypothetical protein
MTGHFTTLDGCESYSYAYRVYRMESVEYSRGLAHYVEVR